MLLAAKDISFAIIVYKRITEIITEESPVSDVYLMQYLKTSRYWGKSCMKVSH